MGHITTYSVSRLVYLGCTDDLLSEARCVPHGVRITSYNVCYTKLLRYCESDRFTEMAATLTAGRASGYDQCIAIVDYIRNSVRYTPGLGQQIISATEGIR